MKRQYNGFAKLSFTIAPLVLLLVAASGCATSGNAATAARPGGTAVRAVETTGKVTIDGKIGETAWDEATPIKVSLEAEIGVEAKNITLRALYDKQNVYLAAEYADGTPVKMNEAWVYNGAAWQKGGYDDTLAFIWNIDDSVPGFNDTGLSAMTRRLSKGLDVFDFNLAAPTDTAAKAKADFWGW